MSLTTFWFMSLYSLVLVSPSYQQCDPVEPPEHGRIKLGPNHQYYQVFCDHDYFLDGKSTLFCVNNRWEGPRPECKEYVCEDLPHPENGLVECEEAPLIPGKICTVKCFDGYKLQGSSVRRCMSELLWSGFSKCERISDTVCPMPPALEHGSIINCTSVRPRDSDRCHFRCNDGYFLEGPSFLTCRSNGKFTDNDGKETYPKCIEFSFSESVIADKINQRANAQNSDVSNNYYSSRVTISDDVCLNHQCEQICQNKDGRAQCRCERGYKLNSDQRTCRFNNCRVKNGGCSHICKKINDAIECSCHGGYTLQEDGKNCTRTNPCNVYNGGCSHKCKNEGGEAICSCHTGYTLHSDGKKCIVSDPCHINNGGCSHICEKVGNTRRCLCRNGYTLQRDGKNCLVSNPCRVNNGGCSHICKNAGNAPRCLCRNGYTLQRDGKNCIDIDECSKEDLNNCQHYCNNTEGGFTCSCKPSYLLIDGYKCEGCRKNSYWSIESNACVDCPKHSHTDSEGKASVKDCICNSGYIGFPGDYVACEDINECGVNNFGCSDICVNIPGSAYCICPTGFELDFDNKTCTDIDECVIKNGGCEGVCINTLGSFVCTCPEGFKQSNKDRYSCDDINECDENNGGCEQLCVNYHGGFYCACKPGYHLDATLKNCTDILCPKLPLPHFSNMTCEKKSVVLPQMDNYPAGTTCTFNCFRGFKNTQDSNKLKCRKDGTWKGMLPECKPQNCPPLGIPVNGEVRPSSCSTQGAAVKERCNFNCHSGYQLKGHQVFVCKNNLTWNKENIPVCEPVNIKPIIKCPPDIHVALLQGKATYNITLPEPETNMKNYEVQPSWVTVNKSVEFSAGVTQVTFTAISLITNETAKCVTTVTVLDEEPPFFHSCPEPIKIEGAKGDGELVTWEEPVVSDNVELVSVFSILKPNTTLTPGTHFVEYVARDSSGNIGTCSFDISIVRMNCSNLNDPIHGQANCMDWMFGKLCNPECDVGYMRYPGDPLYYSCDDSGVWEPGDIISECLQFTLATSAVCEDEFELKTNEETGEKVCVGCPSNTIWSSTSRECERTAS